MSGAALLELDQVACRRGGRMLFEDLSLILEPGGAALVTGPNGIGKSSLLRLAGGLLAPVAGTVRRPVPVALADDRAALDERLTLGRALEFWARQDSTDPAVGMQAMGLAHLDAVPVRILSTGQRKRATLARVISSGARLWLLDEPANGLDAEGLERLAAAMARHRKSGGGILTASHQALGLDDAQPVKLR
ncbi:MAG: heme ABC exporter ATP-binding protein CcmA [Sphingosinicella sp.]|nr:heme ABC exporter ATP-binding protein CcmA [Sphingosinicella sp.]